MKIASTASTPCSGTHAIVYFADTAHDTNGLKLFAREVIPALA